MRAAAVALAALLGAGGAVALEGRGCDPTQPAPWTPAPTMRWDHAQGADCYRLRLRVVDGAVLESQALCGYLDPETFEWRRPGVDWSVPLQRAFPELPAGLEVRVAVYGFNEHGDGGLSPQTVALCWPLALEPLP